METFSAWLALCAGNSPVTGEFPTQRPVPRSFDGFFYLRLSKQVSKQSLGWWFEMPSCSLWLHCNDSWWIEMPWCSVDITWMPMIAVEKLFRHSPKQVIMVTILPWLAAPVVVNKTTSSAASNDKMATMATFQCQGPFWYNGVGICKKNFPALLD